jgi:hypothetical protein
MTGAEAKARRMRAEKRLVEGALRRQRERAVYAEFGVKPDWWPR